jgi:hypothetical protein
MARVDFPEAVIPRKTITQGDFFFDPANSLADIAFRQLEIPGSLLQTGFSGRCIDSRISGGEQTDLSPNIGPIAFIKIKHGHQSGVTALPTELIDEILGKLIKPMEIEIHGQESDITGHIAVTKPLIEFYTIEDIHLVREADIGRVQIAMAITDTSSGNAVLEQIFPVKHIPGIL